MREPNNTVNGMLGAVNFVDSVPWSAPHLAKRNWWGWRPICMSLALSLSISGIVQVVSRNFSLNRSHDSELERAFMVCWVVYWTWQVFKFSSLLSVVMGLFTVMCAQCPSLWIEVRLEVTFMCYNSSWSCATGVILMLTSTWTWSFICEKQESL